MTRNFRLQSFRAIGLLAATLFVAGCASTKLDEPATIVDKGAAETTAAAASRAPATSAPAVGAVNERAVTAVDATGANLLNDPNGPLAKRSVYFEFDSFVVPPQYQTVVESHAQFLNTYKARKVVVEGNADERGSREYNLALGQKRADAVKSRLGLLGVAEQRVETISLGEEKPRATGHDEASWAENRRADIVYR